MAKLIPLDQAAKILGITSEELVEMRSRNEIAGYRDGASWKFKQAELDRVKSSLNADGSMSDDLSLDLGDLGAGAGGPGDSAPISIDDDLTLGSGAGEDEGESILVTEDVLGEAERSTSSTVIGKDEGRNAADSDLKLVPENDHDLQDLDADMTLAGGSGLDLRLEDDADLAPAAGRLGDDSGIDLVTADDDDDNLVLAGDSDASPVVAGGGDFEDDELVLDDGDVDVTLSGDSGMNLTSPSDSGISLEGLDDDLDLGDGAFELGDDEEEAPVAAKGKAAPRQREEAFDLTPDQGLVSDDDESSSQVIALDPDQFVDGFEDEGADADGGPLLEEEDDLVGEEVASAAAVATASAVMGRGADDGMDLTTWNIVALSCLSLLMFLSGVVAIDVVRNIWSWNGYGFSAILVEALSSLVK